MKGIENIAVGFDGSPDAEAALGWAARLSAALGAELTVVHAVGLLEHAGLAGSPTSHEQVVRNTAAASGLDPASVHWSVVDGDPCSALLRAMTPPSRVDLVVVGTGGAGRSTGSLLGSTRLEVAEHASVPVVIVPVADAALAGPA
jgi:nucleotide-binding universal stress UspA family protein